MNVTGAGDPLDALIANTTATITTALRGDANLDGTVNGADLNTVLSDFNTTGMSWAQGDFDGNGTVNGADLNTVLSNFNQHVGVSAAMDAEQFAANLSQGARFPNRPRWLLAGLPRRPFALAILEAAKIGGSRACFPRARRRQKSTTFPTIPAGAV